jgi:hypothetical protein
MRAMSLATLGFSPITAIILILILIVPLLFVLGFSGHSRCDSHLYNIVGSARLWFSSPFCNRQRETGQNR